MRRLTFRLLLALLALSAGPALAEEPAPAKKHDPRAAFTETDKNQDGKIDREEFHQRVMEIFFFGDRDKDGYMTREELVATVVFPEDFADADRDGDGRYSYAEFVQVRFVTFDEVDDDDDGMLSVDEVVAAYEGKS
jgi:Ca2+-binding EF-hand superfamily protein